MGKDRNAVLSRTRSWFDIKSYQRKVRGYRVQDSGDSQMTGSNEWRVNEATMIAAVQLWLNSITAGDAPKVTGVHQLSDKTFSIHTDGGGKEMGDIPGCPLQVPQFILDADKKYDQARREAVRKLAKWIQSEAHIKEWSALPRCVPPSYIDWLTDKILEAME